VSSCLLGARHKPQPLAHDPARYRRAGRVVAAGGSAPRAQTEVTYRDLFLAAQGPGLIWPGGTSASTTLE
jgi:hypothetical protein